MADVNSYAPKTGRVIKEDGSVVNEADLMTKEDLYPKKITIATAGVITQLADLAVERVLIKADPNNTGLVKIHASGTPTAGDEYVLEAGEILDMGIDNLNKIFVTTTVNGEILYRLGLK